MKDKEKIEHILEFTCGCGYNFKNYIEDAFEFSASELIWMEKVEFVICLGCKKKYKLYLLNQYIRKLKIKNICQNIIT
jgi:hypothetical protein